MSFDIEAIPERKPDPGREFRIPGV